MARDLTERQGHGLQPLPGGVQVLHPGRVDFAPAAALGPPARTESPHPLALCLHGCPLLAVVQEVHQRAAGRLDPLGLAEIREEFRPLRLQPLHPEAVLELAEAGLDDAAHGGRLAVEVHEQRGGAVPHAELALDRLRLPGQELSHVVLGLGAVQADQAGAVGVDPAPPRAARHLRELVQAQPAEARIAPLPDPLDHHGLRRHVDPQAHGLGGEDHPHQPALEQDLRQPLQGRQDAGVVHPRAPAQPGEEERIHLRLGHDAGIVPQRVGDGLLHLGTALGRKQGVLVIQVPRERPLAPGSAEDEIDGRKPAPLAEPGDHLGRAGGAPPLPVLPEAVPVAAPRLAAVEPDSGGGGRRATGGVQRRELAVRMTQEVREGHGPHAVQDGMDGAMDLADPGGDLGEVADGGGAPDELDRLGRVDDDLFPDRAPSLVPKIVALVQDRRGDVLWPLPEQEVPQDLGGHHQNGGTGIYLHVAGENADEVPAVLPDEVGILLVAQGLQGGGVDDTALCRQGLVDREFRDEGLAGPGRRRDEDRLSALPPADGLLLKGIEREGIPLPKRLEERLVFWARRGRSRNVGERWVHGGTAFILPGRECRSG